MASNAMPIPAPPRTPTPPPEDREIAGLGLRGVNQATNSTVTYDPNSLAPMSEENLAPSYGSLSATAADPLLSTTPSSNYGESTTSTNSSDAPNPFNFQTTSYTLSKSPITKSNVGQRRGHKYKHSSVSHQIFLEPTPRPPLSLPASLPIPTLRECYHSITPNQRNRSVWCLAHAFVAAYTLYSASGSLALTALSHLILFDALGTTLCVLVDVLSNFDVWKRSSIRHPFGLERAEVLAGFAMSVFLLFMGLDLISHNLQHILEGWGNHTPHRAHEHQRVSPGSVDLASLLAIVSTLVSAIGLGNHARIGKAMRFAAIENLPSVLSNPSHFLTLSCSALLLLLPLLSVQMYVWLDRLLSTTIATCMIVLGARLVRVLGAMLLMSYAGTRERDVQGVMREIERDGEVARVEEARFWQVHYGLCMANLKIRVRGLGGEEGVGRLRERIASLVRNRLGGGYGVGGLRWEVSTQLTLDRDG